jgi:prepilin-type N-terminal cleavage/methylation domain-containing protein
MRKHICRSLGFTLVELLVVISIIAILAAIALPNFRNVRIKARETEVARNLDTIRKALEQFAVDHNGLYPYRVHAYDAGGQREIINTDEDGFAPLGIWGGVETTDALGAPLVSYIERGLVEPVWSSDQVLHCSFFNQHTDPLKVYGYIVDYPENPFLRRPMGAILWAFTGTDVTIPSPQVIVLPGDFVYTSNMGDAIDPTNADSDRADPASVIPNAESYVVTSLKGMPQNGPMYAIYDNNDHATPIKPARARKDWNQNGAFDEFEKGIVMYFSGGKPFYEERTSTGQRIEY